MNFLFKSNNHGFTLVELLIVTTLIAILATLGINQFAIYRIKGFNTAAYSDLGMFKSSMEFYYSEHHAYP